MSKINSYPTNGNVTYTDKLIGTDADDSNKTKNFTVGDILELPIPTVPVYANNAAAVAAGLPVGKIYRIAGTDNAGVVY